LKGGRGPCWRLGGGCASALCCVLRCAVLPRRAVTCWRSGALQMASVLMDVLDCTLWQRQLSVISEEIVAALVCQVRGQLHATKGGTRVPCCSVGSASGCKPWTSGELPLGMSPTCARQATCRRLRACGTPIVCRPASLQASLPLGCAGV